MRGDLYVRPVWRQLRRRQRLRPGLHHPGLHVTHIPQCSCAEGTAADAATGLGPTFLETAGAALHGQPLNCNSVVPPCESLHHFFNVARFQKSVHDYSRQKPILSNGT